MAAIVPPTRIGPSIDRMAHQGEHRQHLDLHRAIRLVCAHSTKIVSLLRPMILLFQIFVGSCGPVVV